MTYINGGHWQWTSWYLTPPPPCHTVNSSSLYCRSLPCMQDAVSSFTQCSTGLYPSLPAAGNQHHTTSHGPGSALQHNPLDHLFCFASWGKDGGGRLGSRQSSFYRTTPGLTKEYIGPVGHWKQHIHGGSFNCPPCMLGCLITVEPGLYSNMSEEQSSWQLYMRTYRIA